jgi:hypothetical protein
MVSKTAKFDDFDVDKIAVAVDQHAKEMTGLDARIAKLEAKIGTNDNLAETLEAACSKAVKMRDVFLDEFVRMLAKEERVQKSVEKLVDRVDRIWFLVFLKRIGFAMWSLTLFVGGYCIKIFIDKFSH